MNTNPAVAGPILRNFSIVFVTAVSAVFAIDGIFQIANRNKMGGIRSQLGLYNAEPKPEQDRLDTIFDRTKIMHSVKEKKPWNMTLAEKERTRH
ncbi:hypothetical protein G7Y89_g12476 [Cudoniella acicularis]|uniref:Uncharacterized protein n=1 Tax=Cudoniella acicularis TaxID=354080 RepID=A0A8H4RBR7_9HELO|nr:hypothetical protein G7Y89_g12476 [Cudoniella acicularis]